MKQQSLNVDLDLSKLDTAIIASAILELRAKILLDQDYRNGRRLAAGLFCVEEFRAIVDVYCEQAKAETPQQKGIVAATLTVGIEIGHAIARKQLEAAGLKT